MRPGITVRPERSTVSAPAGTPIVAARPDAGDAVAVDDDAAVLDRRRAAAVDDADVVEDDSRASARSRAAATDRAIATMPAPVVHRSQRPGSPPRVFQRGGVERCMARVTTRHLLARRQLPADELATCARQYCFAPPPSGRDVLKAGRKLDSCAGISGLQDV